MYIVDVMYLTLEDAQMSLQASRSIYWHVPIVGTLLWDEAFPDTLENNTGSLGL